MRTLSLMDILGKCMPLNLFSALLGDEDIPLPNILGIKIKYFSGFKN